MAWGNPFGVKGHVGWARFRLMIAISFLIAAEGARAATTASPSVDCQYARYTPETTICDDPTLKAQDRSVASAYDRLLSRYTGEDRATFAAGQKFWHIEVNDCRNSEEPELIRACVATHLTEREALLAKLEADPTELATTVADYALVEPPYLLKFARQYEGKKVGVFGRMTIEACRAQKKASLKGRLDGKLEVRFKSLPEDEISFLCPKGPFSWWDGVVGLDHGRPYLYLTDILGVDLP